MKEKMKSKKDIKYYLSLPWTYSIETETHKGKSYYIIRVNELPGVCTDAVDLNEGMEDIKDAIACAVEAYQELGRIVPEPIDRNQYKGKILYRTDSERHYQLAQLAKSKHKSISKTLDIVIDVGMQQIRLNQ